MFVGPNLRIGGAERHIATLLPMLDRSRFTASVVCIGERGELLDPLEAAGFRVRALHRGKLGAVLALGQLVREMRRTRPDVVVVRGFNAELLGRVAARLAGVPHSVVWVHNCGDLRPRSLLQRLSERLLQPLTSAYFGVAHGQLPYLTGELGVPEHKIRIIQNGIDPEQFPFTPSPVRDAGLRAELGVGADDVIVGIVAVLRPEKDHATFLRAAKLVAERVPGARFLVVGDGPERDTLTREVTELGISDRVVFTGSRADVARLIALMDVSVLSSHTIECFPMALLEAMAIGRPSVCTAVGGIPEMIEEGRTGHVVPARDPQALADRLVGLLEQPARARSMGQAARRRLESEFTLERSVRAAQRQLEETVGRSTTGPMSSRH